MRYIDIFNGDADGIFSLLQWRKSHPIVEGDEQVLVTDVKRGVALVKKVSDAQANDANITILDVSFDKNGQQLERILSHCHSVFYCDHHQAKTLFAHPKLITHINTAPTVCTGLLINQYLRGEYPLWAIAAAYGDGLTDIANRYVKAKALSEAQCEQLQELGVLVNYNGYGSQLADLYFQPDALYQQLMVYDTPFDIVGDSHSPLTVLKQGYQHDIELARASTRLDLVDVIAIVLEDAPWARRISGTFGNQLAAQYKDKPIIIVTTNQFGSYTISLRAPKNNPQGASSLCGQFLTGGGREGAAGINALPKAQLEDFINKVTIYYHQ